MQPYFKAFRMFALAAMFSAAMTPTFAFADHGTGDPGKSHADVPGRECQQVAPPNNPHCSAPEVPFAVIYPVLGAATLAVAMYYRSRRQAQGVMA